MKIEAQPREDQQVMLTVEFEPEVYNKFKRQAARKISQESKVPGFRPGKAPFEVIRRLFGDRAIENQAVDLLIDKEYPEIIKQADLQPSGPGSLQNVETTDIIKLELLVPLQPEIDLGDYRSVRLDYKPEAVPEEEVDKYIERLRNSYASVEPVERPIEETDLVYLTISGHLTSPAEGENPEVFVQTPQQVIVQSEDQQKPEEWPFVGFTRQLIGLSAGDEKTIAHSFPDDAKEENLRGREVEFHIHIESVKAMKLPDLSDEFAQTVGEYDTVDALRSSITERMEHNAQHQYEEDFITKVIDQIREQASLKYPPHLLDNEINQMLERLDRDLAQQKLDLETYLKIRKLDKAALIEQDIKPAALLRLERSLVMDEVARLEKLQLDPKMVENEITETVNAMEMSGEFKKTRKGVSNEQLADAVAYEAASRLMSRQTMDRLREIATGSAEQPADINVENPEAPAGPNENEVVAVQAGEPLEDVSPSAEEALPDQPKPDEDLTMNAEVSSEPTRDEEIVSPEAAEEELSDQSEADSLNN